jgi:histone-lysine N-methyltransferase SETMAR
MLIAFFIIKDIIQFEFVSKGQTDQPAYYMGILKQLPEAARRKGPELWPNDWILHYDSAPAQNALDVKHFLAQKSITELEHPPFSPDLSPNDFWLFPKIVCL